MEWTLWLIPAVFLLLLVVALAKASHRMSEAERRWQEWSHPPDDDEGCTEVKFDDPGE